MINFQEFSRQLAALAASSVGSGQQFYARLNQLSEHRRAKLLRSLFLIMFPHVVPRDIQPAASAFVSIVYHHDFYKRAWELRNSRNALRLHAGVFFFSSSAIADAEAALWAGTANLPETAVYPLLKDTVNVTVTTVTAIDGGWLGALYAVSETALEGIDLDRIRQEGRWRWMIAAVTNILSNAEQLSRAGHHKEALEKIALAEDIIKRKEISVFGQYKFEILRLMIEIRSGIASFKKNRKVESSELLNKAKKLLAIIQVNIPQNSIERIRFEIWARWHLSAVFIFQGNEAEAIQHLAYVAQTDCTYALLAIKYLANFFLQNHEYSSGLAYASRFSENSFSRQGSASFTDDLPGMPGMPFTKMFKRIVDNRPQIRPKEDNSVTEYEYNIKGQLLFGGLVLTASSFEFARFLPAAAMAILFESSNGLPSNREQQESYETNLREFFGPLETQQASNNKFTEKAIKQAVDEIMGAPVELSQLGGQADLIARYDQLIASLTFIKNNWKSALDACKPYFKGIKNLLSDEQGLPEAIKSLFSNEIVMLCYGEQLTLTQSDSKAFINLIKRFRHSLPYQMKQADSMLVILNQFPDPEDNYEDIEGSAWLLSQCLLPKNNLSIFAIFEHLSSHFNGQIRSLDLMFSFLESKARDLGDLSKFDKFVCGMACFLIGYLQPQNRHQYFDRASSSFNFKLPLLHASFSRFNFNGDSDFMLKKWWEFNKIIFQYEGINPSRFSKSLELFTGIQSYETITFIDLYKMMRVEAGANKKLDCQLLEALEAPSLDENLIHSLLRKGANPNTPVIKITKEITTSYYLWTETKTTETITAYPVGLALSRESEAVYELLVAYGADTNKVIVNSQVAAMNSK